MARITIEDCVGKIHDRFKLVALAAQRANDINSGSKMTINNVRGDKANVLALREIAAGHITIPALKAQLLKRLRTKSRIDPIDEENTDASLDTDVEEFDYLPSGSDLCVTEDYSDLDDQIFDDNVSNDEQK
ncbi:DNA-directed RNA polymerase subunit omega [Candidatus Tisiphia endosymbiont of Myopa tessellatipennis]|uniref:DNA-directed RNA polymerase subunit omega n=1 Tax=Candidatus Tisiphia endosymbiont of Myopa tessellatipennis TaxID=3066257 RepID=UPI00313B8FE3